MILNLSGASETARAILADRLLDGRKDWRYMALEDIFEDEIPEDLNEIDAINVMVAFSCAAQEQRKRRHIVITFPMADLISVAKEELKGPHVSVYLSKNGEKVEGFDYIVDCNKSLNEILKMLNEIIGRHV